MEELIQETVPKKEDGEGEVAIYKNYYKVFTPADVGKQMVSLLELQPNHSVLEPSAGLGNLIYALRYYAVSNTTPYINMPIYYYELNENHATQIFLKPINTRFIGYDFLADKNTPKFDRIIANPPFDENKWLFHIPKMYKHLVPGGILVTLAPKKPILRLEDPAMTSAFFIEEFNTFKSKMKELGAESYPVENWYTNKDGTKTEIHIIKIRRL